MRKGDAVVCGLFLKLIDLERPIDGGVVVAYVDAISGRPQP